MNFPPKIKRTQEFSSSGTWINPGGINSVKVHLQGGGIPTSSAFSNPGYYESGATFAGVVVARGAVLFVNNTTGIGYQESRAVEADVDVSAGNLGINIGAAGASFSENGNATVTWYE